MANTYTSLHYHILFSTKNRYPWIVSDIEQDGYAAFTVSKSNIPDVIRYIQNQREHHHRKTFQEEYLEFLRANGIDYDERYLWD
jgi:REP element-mobilizing transposase RayT